METVTMQYVGADWSVRNGGRVSAAMPHKHSYYRKLGLCHNDRQLFTTHYEPLEKDFRYMRWHEHTGLVKSKRLGLTSLCHKMSAIRDPLIAGIRCGFDHTSYWRYPGDSWPCLILTEPYDKLRDEDQETWGAICDEYGLQYRSYDASEKSLWYPDATRMVFWWCPKYYTPDWDVLMGHDGWYVLRDQLVYDPPVYDIEKQAN